MQILAVNPLEANFHLFDRFPKNLYPEGHNRLKLPDHLNSDYLDSCFIIVEDDKVLARAALYCNPKLSYKGKNTWCIGNYEAEDNPGACFQLFQHVLAHAKENGAEYILGPMNGSTWDNYRLKVPGSHPDFFMEPCHHPYYHEHFTNANFEVAGRYFSSVDKNLRFDQPEVLAKEKSFLEQGVTFRNINLTEFEKELSDIYDFNLRAFQNNFLFTPISKEAFIKKYTLVKKFIDPNYVILAEDKGQNLIGYFFCIDDHFNKENRSLIVKTLARHPHDQWKGMGHVIGNMIYRRAILEGYTSIIHALVFEDATSIRLSKNFSGEIFKNYILYGKEL